MKRTLVLCLLTGAVVAATGLSGVGIAQGRVSRVFAILESAHEVPAGLSTALGRFTADIDAFEERVDFKLTYDRLEGTITQAHIHIAQPNVNGGIMVWLCGTPDLPGPAGTAACPQSGAVEGTIRPGNVLAVTPQGVEAGNFRDFLAAVRNGLAYANVHSSRSPGGEIRGQIRRGGGVKF
jgi:hypothetical protein